MCSLTTSRSSLLFNVIALVYLLICQWRIEFYESCVGSPLALLSDWMRPFCFYKSFPKQPVIVWPGRICRGLDLGYQPHNRCKGLLPLPPVCQNVSVIIKSLSCNSSCLPCLPFHTSTRLEPFAKAMDKKPDSQLVFVTPNHFQLIIVSRWIGGPIKVLTWNEKEKKKPFIHFWHHGESISCTIVSRDNVNYFQSL